MRFDKKANGKKLDSGFRRNDEPEKTKIKMDSRFCVNDVVAD